MGKITLLKDYAPNEVKRSALGELGNKVLNRGAIKKDELVFLMN